MPWVKTAELEQKPMLSFTLASILGQMELSMEYRSINGATAPLWVTDQYRVTLTRLAKGSSIAAQSMEGPSLVSVIFGTLRFKEGGEEKIIERDQLLIMNKALANEVEALEDSAFLMTVIKPAGDEHLLPQWKRLFRACLGRFFG